MVDVADSAALHAACQSPDREVQAAAYQALWRYLYRVARSVVSDQPDAEALAQDCAQAALVRIHARIGECRAPEAFRVWARRIASRLALDALRARRRLVYPAEADEIETDPPGAVDVAAGASAAEAALESVASGELRALLAQAPISSRSRRVVAGRYLDDQPDEHLAQIESTLTGESVQPSHVQVTRAKDIARLRNWSPLRAFLSEAQAG
jgi:RNA polymerase sigma factor (sigma-70 family)